MNMYLCDCCGDSFSSGEKVEGYLDLCDECVSQVRSLKMSPEEFCTFTIGRAPDNEELDDTIRNVIEPVLSGKTKPMYSEEDEEYHRVRKEEHEGDLRRGVRYDSM